MTHKHTFVIRFPYHDERQNGLRWDVFQKTTYKWNR